MILQKKILFPLLVSLLLIAYLISGVGFSRHVCCHGVTSVTLLLEQSEDCCHSDCQDDGSCDQTEIYQFLPTCLAEKNLRFATQYDEVCVSWVDQHPVGVTVVPTSYFCCSLLTELADDPLIVFGQAQAWSGQWRL